MRVFALDEGLELVGQNPGPFTRGQTLLPGDSLNYQRWVEADEADVGKTFAIVVDWTGWGEKSNWNDHVRVRVIPAGTAPNLVDMQGGMDKKKPPIYIWPGVPVEVSFGYQMAPANVFPTPPEGRVGRLTFKAKRERTAVGTTDEVTFRVLPDSA